MQSRCSFPPAMTSSGQIQLLESTFPLVSVYIGCAQTLHGKFPTVDLYVCRGHGLQMDSPISSTPRVKPGLHMHVSFPGLAKYSMYSNNTLELF